MVNPIVVSYETEPELPGVKRFINSLQRFGWNYHLILEPKWLGFGRRLKKVVETARELNTKGYRWMLHLDARDNIMQGPPSEFIPPEVPLLLAGEENCWMPPVGVTRENYPKGTSIWQFAHSQYVLDTNYCDLMNCDKISDIKDDQLHCHELFFANTRDLVKIDYDCRYVQSIAFCVNPWEAHFDISSGRLYNIATKTYPLVVHSNGNTDNTWVPGYEY